MDAATKNRNSKVSSACRQLAIKHNIAVSQKFLVAGHTQMECDSMHSVIKRKLVVDVFTDRDYAMLAKTKNQSKTVCSPRVTLRRFQENGCFSGW